MNTSFNLITPWVDNLYYAPKDTEIELFMFTFFHFEGNMRIFFTTW